MVLTNGISSSWPKAPLLPSHFCSTIPSQLISYRASLLRLGGRPVVEQMTTDNPAHLEERIADQAHRLGFDLVGVAPAGQTLTARHYRAWLEHGYHGEMAYLARADAVTRREDPGHILPTTRSLLVVGARYPALAVSTRPRPGDRRQTEAGVLGRTGHSPAQGIIARYAWGPDYHDLLVPRLEELAAWIRETTRRSIACRAYVDTGPVLERELAARAGLGFIGRNTCLIHPRLGSWLFLGVLLLDIELPATGRPAQPREWAGSADLAPLLQGGTCGRCTRCLDACPTGALVAPYTLDARRCISYLTIELRGPIPRPLRPLLGHHIFGCDVCQEVCPWNACSERPAAEPACRPSPEIETPELLSLFALDEEGFRQHFRKRPLWRARRRGLLRNVAVALGNWGDPIAIPALSQALHDHEPLIRGHAAWALGQIPIDEARYPVARALEQETDGWVREELHLAQSR
jgi:epoxyqueuosine reductase